MVALSIAGSDSGGGAGIQADLKTFAAHGVLGATAVTAVTAQHTAAVVAVAVMSPEMVLAQVDAVLTDLPPAAVKTGMLANPAVVTAVAGIAAQGRLPKLVVDPVLVSTSGHALMDEGGVEAYRTLLLPHAVVATPNLHEAALLTGCGAGQLRTLEGMVAAAQALRELGASTVVVKGGHAPSGGPARNARSTVRRGTHPPPVDAPDVVAGPGGVSVLHGPRIDTRNDHGTGCSLSAAIAARLALGATVLDAIKEAKDYVGRALAGAAGWRLGSGHGPIDHFGWSEGPVSVPPRAP